MKVIHHCTLCCIGLLFVYTGTSKLAALAVFKQQLSQSVILGPYATVLAPAVPLLELLTAGALLWGRYRLYALYTALWLMTAFTVYLTLMLLSGTYLPCSCGGIIGWLSWQQHLGLNTALILLLLPAIVYETRLQQRRAAAI